MHSTRDGPSTYQCHQTYTGWRLGDAAGIEFSQQRRALHNSATEVPTCDGRPLASVIPRTNFLKQTSAVVNYSGGDMHSPSR